MLLWINGPFGVGKTATADELHRRLPGSVVCDPEQVGVGMNRMLPRPLRGDFQNLPAWRHSVRELLRFTESGFGGPVIVPMTLTNVGYFDEIVGALRADGCAVHHVALLAEPETVRRRLRARSLGTESRPGSWAMARLDGGLRRLAEPRFAEHIHTDQLTVAQAAEAVAGAAGLTLAPATGGPLRAAVRRYRTTAQHIHWH